jgi:hypothetical protein
VQKKPPAIAPVKVNETKEPMPQTEHFKRVAREIVPQGFVSHVAVTWERDEASVLETRFTTWLTNVNASEGVFRLNVYENSDLQDSDLRQHRIILFALLCEGENLALDFIKYGAESNKAEEVAPSVQVVEIKVKALFDVLLAWHGPFKGQSDIPESLKQAVREAEEGKIVDAEF